jgi:UPF0271 protein
MDLNADIGEHDGYDYSRDIAILSVISSANIACGVHAGSRTVMRQTIALARERGVTIGAHPSYPDRPGFGRRELALPNQSIVASFVEQIEAMMDCCELEGARLRYVKPHGALYNRAARDEALAETIAESVCAIDSSLYLLGLSGSFLETSAKKKGISVAREAFIDRGYMPDGSLVPRTEEGAVIEDPQLAANRAIEIVASKSLTAVDGTRIDVEADSLCVHGDSRNSLETVIAARTALEHAGFTIVAFAR